MVAAAALDAFGLKSPHIATIQNLVDAVRQIMTIEGVTIATARYCPRVFKVIAADDTVNVRCGNIIHVTAHDDVGRRLVDGFAQFLSVIVTQGSQQGQPPRILCPQESKTI